jgi:hypothetical protein
VSGAAEPLALTDGPAAAPGAGEPSAVAPPGRGIARAVATADAGLAGLTGGLLRLEDVVLLAWLVLGIPVSRAIAGGSNGDPLATDSDPLSGILWLLATFLAIAVVATRSPGDPVIGFEDMSTPRSYAPLPFLVSLAIVSETALGRLGVESDALIGIVFIVTMVSYVAYPHLPNLPRAVRRLMILPFILIAGGVFGGLVLDQTDLFDFRALLGDPSVSPSAFAALLGLDVLFSGIFYLAFIFAPRMVAEAEGSWRAWFVRYLVFLGATIVGVTFFGAAGG